MIHPLFDRIDPPPEKRSDVPQRICDAERSRTVGEPDPEFRQTRGCVLGLGQTLPQDLITGQIFSLAESRREIDLAEIIATQSGTIAFLRMHGGCFQTPSAVVSDRFAVFTTAQALFLKISQSRAIRCRGHILDIHFFAHLCQCHGSSFDYSDGESEGKYRV